MRNPLPVKSKLVQRSAMFRPIHQYQMCCRHASMGKCSVDGAGGATLILSQIQRACACTTTTRASVSAAGFGASNPILLILSAPTFEETDGHGRDRGRVAWSSSSYKEEEQKNGRHTCSLHPCIPRGCSQP